MRNKFIVVWSTVLFAILPICAHVASGQIVEKKTLTLLGAERVIVAAKAEAQKLQAPGGVIAVVDDGGNRRPLNGSMAHSRLAPTSPSARPKQRSCLRSLRASSKN